MSLSRLPLSYCTNVHPGRSLAEVEAGLDRYTVPVKQAFGQPLAAGLWLAEPVVRELRSDSSALQAFAHRLSQKNLTCHTLNAFPYGDFHDQRVKEKVYLPDWSQPQRLAYTESCAVVLAALLADEVDGSISTLPLGFKRLPHGADFVHSCSHQIIQCAKGLGRLYESTGKMIRLAIEPEPLCVLETTGEAIRFFQSLWKLADRQDALDIVRMHIGLCYDVCHQAVEFEDMAESIASLDDARVQIDKVHISCAIQIDHPGENQAAREALRQYIEPRYLHQTFASSADGEISRELDLNEQLLTRPPSDFATAEAWRVHFHVPVDADRLGPLTTTRPALREALAAVAKLPYAPHLEVETYTWQVLPNANKPDLVEGLSTELASTRQLLSVVENQA